MVPVQPTGESSTIVGELDAPWSVVRLASGSALVSERDTGLVRELTPSGELRDVGAVDGVAPQGEGGLLGLAVSPAGDELYAYFTGDDDNRIVRMPLAGGPGGYTLGPPSDVLTGIPSAGNHNGGRLAFGPDGMLYATAGDAGDGDAAQDPASLSGKILRMTPDGGVPGDNPWGNHAYSMGHRNPQGIAWDSRGRLWASEFGQNTWDELNLIRPGADYGWPIEEGVGPDPALVDPVYQWPTAEASPSGLAIVGDTIMMASLRGERLWAVYPGPDGAPAEAVPYFIGEFGRLRDVIAGPGALWIVTNNTDGRGDPRDGDDRILQLPLAPRG